MTLLAPALAVEDVVTACDQKELDRIRKVSNWDVKPVQLLGTNGWDDPALFEKAGRYVECAVFVDGFFPASERLETKRFVAAFQERYGRAPSILEASAYDAARLVAQAVEKDKADGRDAVRTALSGVRAFPGATGDIAFDAKGEPLRALFFLTFDKSGIRELRADEMAATRREPVAAVDETPLLGPVVRRRPRWPWMNAVLFLATLASVVFAGAGIRWRERSGRLLGGGDGRPALRRRHHRHPLRP